MPPLVPCAECRRHIRVDHSTCPFCSTAVPAGFAARAIPPARKRLDRLATFTFATTLALAACGEIADEAAPGAGTSRNGNGIGNGNGPVTGVHDAGAGSADAGAGLREDASSRADRDAASDAAPDAWIDSGFDDDGGISADYGQPPVDAGNDSDNVAPLYGAPPLDAG